MRNWKYINGAEVGNAWNDYSVRWTEFNSRDQLVTKQKDFPTEDAMTKFIEKLSEKDNFNQVVATSSPTKNSKTGNSTWYEPRRMPFQPRALRYAYEQAKKKGLSGQKLEAEMLRIVKTTPHESAATESEMRKDVSEWVLHNGTPEDFVNNKGAETGNFKTGKSNLKPGDRVRSYGKEGTVKKVMDEFSDTIYGEPLIEVEWADGKTTKVGEHYMVKIGNAFDFKTQKIVDAKDWLAQAEENLRKAELDVKKNPGDKFFLEQLNAEKRSVERAKENLKRAQSMNSSVGNETMREWATSKPKNVGNWKFNKGWYYDFSYDELAGIEKEFQKQCGLYRDKNGKGNLYEVWYQIRHSGNGYDGFLCYGGKGEDHPDRTTRMTLKLPSDFKKVGNAKVINSDREFFKELADDAKEREDKDDKEVDKLVGNKSNYRYKGFLITFSENGIHVFQQDGFHLAFGPTGSEEKAKDWCDWHDPKTNKPVAEFRNSKVGNIADKHGVKLKVGDKVDVRGKIGKVTKVIGDVIEVFYDNSGTYNPDRTDRHYADEATKVGNSKVGNGATIEGLQEMIKTDEAAIKELKGKKYDSMGYSAAEAIREYQDEIERMKNHIERLKKTQNGLARARNAMNKKTGNAWNDAVKGAKKSDFSIRTFKERDSNGFVTWWYEIKGPNGFHEKDQGYTTEQSAKADAEEAIEVALGKIL